MGGSGVRVRSVLVSPSSLLSPLGADGHANIPLMLSVAFCSCLGQEAVTAWCHFSKCDRVLVYAGYGELVEMRTIWLVVHLLNQNL